MIIFRDVLKLLRHAYLYRSADQFARHFFKQFGWFTTNKELQGIMATLNTRK